MTAQTPVFQAPVWLRRAVCVIVCLAGSGWIHAQAQAQAQAQALASPSPLASIASLDVPRYLGTWPGLP